MPVIDHLGKSVVVGGGQLHAVLDLCPGLVGPRLGAEEADAEVQIGEVEAGIARGLGDEQRVRRSAHDHRRLVVLHDHQLTSGVARRGGDDGGADAFQPCVQTESAGGQAVAEGDLGHILRPRTAGDDHTSAQLGPGIEISPGVSDDPRL